MSSLSAWKTLVVKYANGRPICNCGDAYYSPCGVGIDANGNRRTDMLTCSYGCSSNYRTCVEEIAGKILDELRNQRHIDTREDSR